MSARATSLNWTGARVEAAAPDAPAAQRAFRVLATALAFTSAWAAAEREAMRPPCPAGECVGACECRGEVSRG